MNGYHPVRIGEWCFGRESVVQAIAAIGRGELVVVVDDESRENEGDLIMVGYKAVVSQPPFSCFCLTLAVSQEKDVVPSRGHEPLAGPRRSSMKSSC
jgi:hypothetical protein